jgi:hypothetical protein
MLRSVGKRGKDPAKWEEIVAATATRLVIDGADEYDAETSTEDHLVVGLLGESVRHRWVCRRCGGGGCVIYVERYRERSGSSFALCGICAYAVTDVPAYVPHRPGPRYQT